MRNFQTFYTQLSLVNTCISLDMHNVVAIMCSVQMFSNFVDIS